MIAERAISHRSIVAPNCLMRSGHKINGSTKSNTILVQGIFELLFLFALGKSRFYLLIEWNRIYGLHH